jgi:hypothetical protein
MRPELIGQIFERFSSLIAAEGSLNPLKQAMELGEIDFTRLPGRSAGVSPCMRMTSPRCFSS